MLHVDEIYIVSRRQMYATIELDKLSVGCRRYMAEILPIRRKTPSNQSINQSINRLKYKPKAGAEQFKS